MKRIRIKPLPRGWRVALCSLAAAVLLFTAYVVSGYPAFSPEQALRRAERRALIGLHGNVLATEPQMLLNSSKTQLLIVEYGDAAGAFYDVSQNSPLKTLWGTSGSDVLYLFPKAPGGTTVAACPGYPRYLGYPEETLLIAVFDAYPQATRAELSFTLAPKPTAEADTPAVYPFQLEAARETAGLFLFSLSAPESTDEEVVMQNSYVFVSLAELCSSWYKSTITQMFADARIPATVRFMTKRGMCSPPWKRSSRGRWCNWAN